MIDDIYVSVSFQLEAAIEMLEILVEKAHGIIQLFSIVSNPNSLGDATPWHYDLT